MKHFLWLAASALLLALFSVNQVSAQDEIPTVTPPPVTSTPISGPPIHAHIINAVNNLRIAHGLTPLGAHPVLMQIGQQEADGIASGREGHWRPDGISLGHWLIRLGYPLSGDLSLDGYRSENWGFAQTAEDAINMWLSDDEHSNTMLSIYRSDIGVGIAFSPENEAYVIVVETALQTKSGQPQTEALAILTGIPQTQAAYSSMATEAAKNGLLPQGMYAVTVNTPLADGSVYHDVKYGQTLWGIAIAYNTTIKKIQELNGLTDTTVRPGEHLLILKNAAQPTDPASLNGTPDSPPSTFPTLTVTPVPTSTPLAVREYTEQEKRNNTLGIVGIAIAALFLGGLFTAMTKRKPI